MKNEEFIQDFLDKFDRDFFNIRTNFCTPYDHACARIKYVQSDAEKIDNIRSITNAASQSRYMDVNTAEVILANLIMQILAEIEGAHQEDDVIKMIFQDKVELEEALEPFDFYKNNPYKEKAEKNLAKLEQKRRARGA